MGDFFVNDEQVMEAKVEKMYCEECNQLIVSIGRNKEIIEKYKIPFVCKTCGNIKFPFKALNGVVFIWPKPIEEKVGSIFMPEVSRENFKSYKGVVLSTGKGVIDRKTGEFRECELKTGDEVLYDNSIPWAMNVEASDGKEYQVRMANTLDINALVL